MKGLIIYETKGGATRTYAEWLSQETGFQAVPARKARRFDDYDMVIIGSCVRMYKPTLSKWIVRKWPLLSRKKTVLFTVAGASSTDLRRDEWVRNSIGEIANKLPHFALDGKMKFDDLSWFERALMKFAIRMTAKSNPEEARRMGLDYDLVKRERLEPLRGWLLGFGVALKRD